MSSKPGSKAAKHPTPGHKRKAGTSERSSASPNGSLISDGGEGEGAGSNPTVHPLDEILTGDDIQALRITDEKLRKLHPLHCTSSSTVSAPPLPDSSKQVMVRRTRAPDHIHKRNKRVAVLRPLPDDVSVSATRTLELGARRRGKKSDGEPPPVHTAPSPHDIPNSSPHTFSYIDTIVPRETHALQYWDEAMEDRKHQQDYLTKRLQKSPEMLAMNRGDGYREVQEERMRIDRAIPPLDYGKGYRVGSEFWSQTVPIGDVETGINTTLSCSERGQPLPLETIGVPRTLRREKGTVSTERNAPLHYTWQTTPYLTSRTQQLHSTLTDIQDTKPDMDELEVIGHAPHHSPHSVGDHSLDSLGEEESHSEDNSSNDEDNSHGRGASLDMLPETYSHPLMGPALTVEGHLLKWEGPPRPGSKSSLEPLDVRVTFESGVEEEVTSCLTMENSGTSAIYYSWKHLVQPNPLQTVQAGDTQRFYFDIRGGVLLPGQQLSFPFVFKSPNAGIFTEIWALQTGPVIAQGRAIRVTLRGVAFQEDTSKHRRDELEQELNHKIAVVAAERLINQIVDSIATPPHSPPPLQTTPTEEEMFKTNNPQLFYHYNVVQQLKMLYNEIMHPELLEDHPPPSGVGDTAHTATPTTRDKGKTASGGAGKKEKGGGGGKDKKGKIVKEETQKESVHEITEESPKLVSSVPDWDFSTDSLLQVVLGVEEDEAREEKLKQLSDLLGELSFPPPILPHISSYTLVYQLVSEAMEQVSATSQHLCQVMGLPQREACPVKCTSGEDDQLSSTPSSSAVVNKKDKDKKGKKQDTKKLSIGKDKERAPSRSKGVTGKKSRSSVGNKDTESTEPATEQQSTPQSIQVDPVLEKKYKNNFHALVYGILSDTVNKMTLMLPEQI